MTIWKFPIELAEWQKVPMPQGATILSAQLQNHDICLWALVDPIRGMEPREIFIVGTGHMVPPFPSTFIGTVQMAGAALVWHVFVRSK